MVRNVFKKKRFDELQDEMFHIRVQDSLRGISEGSEDVQLLIESNGNQTRQPKKMENRN